MTDFRLALPPRMLLLAALVAAALCSCGYWFWLGRPTAVAESTVARIACVSYAPYRLDGETPFDPLAHVPLSRIDEDLRALSRRFNCVRTYSVGQGLDQVPAVARKYHMKVLMGIWLSRNAKDNEHELALGLATAARDHDAIRAIIVGNEVLLRGELAPEALAADIMRVRAATDLPVTYADVWEFWLKYPQIAPAVSFITIHILPYWEDEPVPIASAVAHVRDIRARMQAAFPGRELLIGETGWPSAGRQREAARPSLVNQARFIREFLNWAEGAQIAYNVIEAFDQPWKRSLEGTAGGYWGIYDANLHEKFALQGPVVEERRWRLGLLTAGLGAALLLLLEVLLRRRSPWGEALMAIAGLSVGAVAAAQVRELVRAERTGLEWAVGIVLSLAALGSTLWLLEKIVEHVSRARTLPAAPPCFMAQGLGPSMRRPGGDVAAIRFLWLFCGAVMNLLLCFDARYRDFPVFLYAGPVTTLLLAVLLAPKSAYAGVEERLLAAFMALSALVILVMEKPVNPVADVWVLLSLGLAATVWLGSAQSWRAQIGLGSRQQ